MRNGLPKTHIIRIFSQRPHVYYGNCPRPTCRAKSISIQSAYAFIFAQIIKTVAGSEHSRAKKYVYKQA